jgi:hypothetical protein
MPLPRTSRLHPSLALEALEERCLPSADVVLEWNALALDALKNDSLLAHPRQNNPASASRALAIVQGAVFDAVNSIDRSYQPYLMEVNAPADASITAAAAQAAHDTLVVLFPEYKPVLDTALARDLFRGGSLWSVIEGVVVGHTVAVGMMAARSHDGSDVMMNWPVGTQPGQWQPDPLHPSQSAWGPDWGAVTPFAMPNVARFHLPPPPPLTSQAYADAYNEVKSLGGDGVTTPTVRTPEQTEIGIFWGYDGSPGLGTPPRLYNQIAETLAVQMHNTVIANARFFALVNLAMADAGIAAWAAKYEYDFWRPVTAIRAGDTDGNPSTVADPTWAPLGAPEDNGGGTNFTPPFPAYPSGHATFGGALFRMMADFFGTDDIHFTIGSDEFNGVTVDQSGKVRPYLTRSFDSFSQAAEENGQSRIYLGIHWRFDKVEGIRLGDRIADYVFGHLLRPSNCRTAACSVTTSAPQGSIASSPGNSAADLVAALGQQRIYTETSMPAGLVVAPVSEGHGRAEVLPALRPTADQPPINPAITVQSSGLFGGLRDDPTHDLGLAPSAADLPWTLRGDGADWPR